MPDFEQPQSDDTGRVQELIDLGRHALSRVTDPSVPLLYKLIPAAAILYVLSPIDLIPDTVPVLTQIDDIAVLIIAARMFVKLADRGARASNEAAEERDTVTTTYRVRDE